MSVVMDDRGGGARVPGWPPDYRRPVQAPHLVNHLAFEAADTGAVEAFHRAAVAVGRLDTSRDTGASTGLASLRHLDLTTLVVWDARRA
jgi:hypothetical protein